MAWHTVKRFADASKPEDLFTGQWQNRPSVLDDYKSYVGDRWNEGFTNAWKLWKEIVPLGYKGSRLCSLLGVLARFPGSGSLSVVTPGKFGYAGW
ncbi:hypothetical protein ACH4S8_39725 [Streptomyces sp. NPDC021080]|uniref:hypothetical protein n=1 Tax=Streptomyces sp. NPDC021080 TaxID=3365110 RepID=UPI0037AC529A